MSIIDISWTLALLAMNLIQSFDCFQASLSFSWPRVGTHRFMSALKLKAGMQIAQLRSQPRKGESIIMILYIIDGFLFLSSLPGPFLVGCHRLVEHRIQNSMNCLELLEFFSSWENDTILMNWLPAGLIFVASETLISNLSSSSTHWHEAGGY